MRKLLSSLAVTALLTASLFAQGGQTGQSKGTTPPPSKSGTAKSTKKSAEVPMAERCIAKTQDGDQCKRKATAGKYCWQHDPNRKSKTAKTTKKA